MILVGDCSEEAVRCFSRLLELDPNNSHAHFGLGIKYCQDKKYEDAIKSISLGEFINTIENLQWLAPIWTELIKVFLASWLECFRPEVKYIMQEIQCFIVNIMNFLVHFDN